ncbi:MAG: TolC family protein, partial [Deltaproteobacteria bacterium]|nr:TolC family protein [Deltaproteobacteria bacterium]
MSRPKSVPLLLVACAVLGTVPPVVAQPRAEPPAPVREAPAAASTTPPAPDGAPLSVAEVTRPAPDLEGIAAEAGGLTTGEVVRRALAASASLREKVAALRGAEEKIQQTMLQFVPRLTATGSYTRLSPVSAGFGSGALVGAGAEGLLTTGPCPGGAPGTCVLDSSGQPAGAARFAVKQLEDSYSVGARLTIPLSDYLLRVSDAAASSEAGREASRLAVEAERLAVATTARTLYFNWLRARASAAIARKAVERTRARLEDARSAFTVGAISRADLLRVEALVANTELLAARSETMVSLTTGQLAILMEDPRPDYRVGEGVPPPASSPLVERPVLELVREAHELRLEVRAIDESLRATRRGASATRAGELPRLDAIGDITH